MTDSALPLVPGRSHPGGLWNRSRRCPGCGTVLPGGCDGLGARQRSSGQHRSRILQCPDVPRAQRVPHRGTVKVAVDLPPETPLLYVSTRPVPGWTATTVEAALPTPVESSGTSITTSVRTVTWTADPGTRIAPGEYQEFSISAGPLPEVDSLVLPTTQTYSDGKIVRWDQPTPASGEEPEFPAPVVAIEAAAPAGETPVPVQPVDLEPTVDGVARGLAAGALALAAAGLVVAVVGLRRRRGAA